MLEDHDDPQFLGQVGQGPLHQPGLLARLADGVRRGGGLRPAEVSQQPLLASGAVGRVAGHVEGDLKQPCRKRPLFAVVRPRAVHAEEHFLAAVLDRRTASREVGEEPRHRPLPALHEVLKGGGVSSPPALDQLGIA